MKCIQENCIIVTKRLIEMLYSWLLPNSQPINQPLAPMPDNVVNIWGMNHSNVHEPHKWDTEWKKLKKKK